MTTILKVKGLWEVTVQTVGERTEERKAQGETKLGDAAGENKPTTSEQTKQKLDEKRLLAYMLLTQAIDDSHAYLIINLPECEPAFVWEKLQRTYQGKTISNRIQLQGQFTELGMEEGGDFLAFAEKIQSMAMEMVLMGDTVSEAAKLFVLYKGLPSSFANIVTSLARDKAVTFESAVDDINDHIRMTGYIKRGNTTGGGERILLADGQYKTRGASSSDKRTCYNCGQAGHLSRDCDKKKKGNNNQRGSCHRCGQAGHYKHDCPQQHINSGGNRRGQQNDSSKVCDNCGGSCAKHQCNKPASTCTHCGKRWHTAKTCRTRARAERALAASHTAAEATEAAQCYNAQLHVGMDAAMMSKLKAANGDRMPTEWIVDLGATAFFCCNRELFTHLEPTQLNTQIMMPDGNSVSSRFKGEVTLAIYVDPTRPREVIKLSNVHYAPDLGVNLLSVPQLLPPECQRHAVTTPTTWELRTDADRLLISAKRQGQLYYLPTLPTAVDTAAVPHATFVAQAEQGKNGHIRAAANKTASAEVPTDGEHSAVESKTDEHDGQLDKPPSTGSAATCGRLSINVPLWHRRLGHLNMAAVRQLHTAGMVTGMNVGLGKCSHPKAGQRAIANRLCGVCARAKSTRQPFLSARTRQQRQAAANQPQHQQAIRNEVKKVKMTTLITSADHKLLGMRVHTDLCGPFRVKTPAGARYFITFLDDGSNFVSVYLLKRKCETAAALKHYLTLVHNRLGRHIRFLHSDNGTEYFNAEVQKLCDELGITMEASTPYTAEQNPKAERLNRTLLDGVRCFILESGLPHFLWGELVMTKAYLRNRSPTTATAVDQTPVQAWTGKKPDIQHLRVIGSKAYVHVPKAVRGDKLQPRAEVGYIVGYDAQRKCYRVYTPGSGSLITLSRDLVAVENSLYKDRHDDESSPSEHGTTPDSAPMISLDDDSGDDGSSDAAPIDNSGQPAGGVAAGDTSGDEASNDVDGDDTSDNGDDDPHHPLPVRRSQRSTIRHDYRTMAGTQRRQPRADAEAEVNAAFVAAAQFTPTAHNVEPRTYDEAINSVDRDKWLEAIRLELQSLRRLGTYRVVELPSGRRPITAKWVFKIKRDKHGRITRYKARIVARGFTQIEGIDYQETYAPVVRHSSMRTVLAASASFGLHVHQYDVDTAYLYGELEEQIFMKIPDGAEEEAGGVTTEGAVWILDRGLYGLKQSGRVWYDDIDAHLKLIGFSRTKSDSCIYVRPADADHQLIILALYVDDIVTATYDDKSRLMVESHLRAKYSMKDLGVLNWHLGIAIDITDTCITMHQRQYTLDLLERFGMGNSHAVATPADRAAQLALVEYETGHQNKEWHQRYRELVGSVMYLATNTRPDIAQAVSYLSCNSSKPTLSHWHQGMRLLKYLGGTIDLGISYTIGSPLELHGFVDSDHGGCVVTKRSTTGMIAFLAGGPVIWTSQKQSAVSLSTAEAEYIACSYATQETLYLKNLLTEMTIWNQEAILLREDNGACIKIANNPTVGKRSKHIDLRYHFVKERISDGDIQLEWIPSKLNTADIFTKALPAEHFQRLRAHFMTNVAAGVCESKDE